LSNFLNILILSALGTFFDLFIGRAFLVVAVLSVLRFLTAVAGLLSSFWLLGLLFLPLLISNFFLSFLLIGVLLLSRRLLVILRSFLFLLLVLIVDLGVLN